MATLRLPDGRVVFVPDGTTPEQMQQMISGASAPPEFKPFVDPREKLIKGAASVAGKIGTEIAAGLSGATRAVPELIKAGQDKAIETFIPQLKPLTDAARRSPIGTLSGSQPADINAPVETINEVRAAGASVFDPTSEAGKQGVEDFQNAVEKVGKPIKFGLSLGVRAAGGEEEQQKFLDVPIGDYLGDLAQDNGASPLLATLAHISPDALLSGLGLPAARGVGSAISNSRIVPPSIPSVNMLKDQARTIYRTIDDSGIKISDDAANRGAAAIETTMRKRGVRQSLTPDTQSAINEVLVDVRAGGLTLEKAEELRQVINNAKGALKPKDAAAAQKLGDLWDDFIEHLKPLDLTNKNGSVVTNAVEVKQWLKAARNLWSRARKTDEIEEILRKAEINVQSQQGNIGLSQTIRTQFRQLANNQKRLKRFTPEEQKFITLVATGDKLERAARTLGKIAPVQTIPILGEVAAIGAAAATGSPGLIGTAIALPVIGGLAKALSNSRTARFSKQAAETVRRGPPN